MVQFLPGCLFVYSKNLKDYEKRLKQKMLLFRCTRSQMFIKKIFLKFLKPHRETTVPEFLFDEVSDVMRLY